ncbi:DNA-binding protein [Vibrio parahaemolyticus]|uniref:DNA-binding protein n=1 Tax=Vibrio parahaemolyticus TaxID=670 RepID=UPI0022B4D23B|nr:DNA-binding protein [Vibrio parahaemolyticus]MCZ5880773.1 DNA-binding protein [Vibrio parahaemolyticus]
MSTDRMQERVNEICNELYSKGEKVSVRVILTFLPDVSSTSTVHKYYANWRKELEANEKSLYDKLGFSSEFTQMFMKEISRFSVEAEQRYKGIADEANEQRDAAIEELAKIEDRLHKQNAVVEQQDKDITHLKSEMVQRESAFEAEVSKLEQSHSVLVSELRQRITQLEKELTESTHTNETLRTELAKSELKLESNQDYVNEVKAKQQQLEERNATLQSDNQSLSQQVTGFEVQRNESVRLEG